MREITTHHNSAFTRDHIRVMAKDEPGSGGACHDYVIGVWDAENFVSEIELKYQHGPIKEVGVNGIADEALLAVIIDRLEAFSLGEFSSMETKNALMCAKQCLEWMSLRQRERAIRGVAGRLEK